MIRIDWWAISHFLEKDNSCCQHEEMVFSFLSLAKVLGTKEMWPDIEEYVRYMVTFYEEMLEKGVIQGQLRIHDHKNRSLALFSSLDGIIGYVVMCDHLDPKETAGNIISVFLNDIEN